MTSSWVIFTYQSLVSKVSFSAAQWVILQWAWRGWSTMQVTLCPRPLALVKTWLDLSQLITGEGSIF